MHVRCQYTARQIHESVEEEEADPPWLVSTDGDELTAFRGCPRLPNWRAYCQFVWSLFLRDLCANWAKGRRGQTYRIFLFSPSFFFSFLQSNAMAILHSLSIQLTKDNIKIISLVGDLKINLLTEAAQLLAPTIGLKIICFCCFPQKKNIWGFGKDI